MQRDNDRQFRIAVLGSGSGTTGQAVLDACVSGEIPGGKCALAISNNSGSGFLSRMRAAGVTSVHLSSITHPDPSSLDEAIGGVIAMADVDVVVLAGYMKKVGPRTLDLHKGRIINIHPALLPKFGGEGMYGMNVHRAVIDAQEKETGATVHLVDSEYDRGPILAQVKLSVLAGESAERLQERVQQAERRLLIDVLRGLAMNGFDCP